MNSSLVAFQYLHGGCGLCLSRPLALKVAGAGSLAGHSRVLDLPEDLVLGYLSHYFMRPKGMVADAKFHSHMEELGRVPQQILR